MPAVVLFIFYFILISWILTRLLKRSDAGWNATAGIGLFSLKVFLGCAYGYLFLTYYGGDDPWKFYQDSLPECQRLIHHPIGFFKDFLPGPYFSAAGSLSQGWAQYREELEYLLMVKFLAICNLFSRNNYYTDILFFDFLVFWGPYLLFKMLVFSWPGKRWILLIVLFCIPSLTFWLSGIRAEGLLLLFISLILYHTNRWRKEGRFFSILWAVLGFAGFAIFRGQFLLAFLPAWLAWLLSSSHPRKALYYFAAVYLIGLGTFFASLAISQDKNLAIPVIRRQQEFLSLSGNTRFALDSLKANVSSFLKIFPQALGNSLMRPSFWEARGVLQWLTSFSIICFWVLAGMLLICPRKDWKEILLHPLILLFLFYGLSQIILIGYVVPFPGAIVRYKAIPELFLIIAMSLAINWKKIFKLK